ncbi:MAG: B12-binding domain-containing radical SAM protein [Deltaproteobacteria bacterium]|nr:MAG: B12-binding domain-containing radical SAM protein [Deltaproteobacteria bacterium]
MRALLVQPEFPISYWGIQYGLPIIGTKVSLPPLGLISLAALLPASWQLRLVDLNAGPLTKADLDWAEVVLTGGMHIQSDSTQQVIAQAQARRRLTVVGGPGPTTAADQYAGADVLFLGEAEGRIEELLQAIREWSGKPLVLEAGDEHPDLSLAPVPRFDLLKLADYASVSVQYSRGCPFLCEFCDIIEIFGRKPRVKSAAQVLSELAELHRLGWRSSVFFVDDNFIGHKRAVKKLLPQMAEWQAQHGHPFELYTEASVNLAGDFGLMDGMVAAGFSQVFVGIESPSQAALEECHKGQNLHIDLNESIDRMARRGLEVMGGFIVGFDSDPDDIFEQQSRFITHNAIPLAMIGFLNALPGTALWRRLDGEGRLRPGWTGDQLERPNFIPLMNERQLIEGYRRLVEEVYSPAAYYARCRAFLERAPARFSRRKFQFSELPIAVRALFHMSVRSPWRREFWRLMATMLKRNPQSLGWVMAHAIQGEHLIRYTREDLLPRLDAALAALPNDIGERRTAARRQPPAAVRPRRPGPRSPHPV